MCFRNLLFIGWCWAEVVINAEDIPLEEGMVYYVLYESEKVSNIEDPNPVTNDYFYTETIEGVEVIEGARYVTFKNSLYNETYILKVTQDEIILGKNDSLVGFLNLSSHKETAIKLFKFPMKKGEWWLCFS